MGRLWRQDGAPGPQDGRHHAGRLMYSIPPTSPTSAGSPSSSIGIFVIGTSDHDPHQLGGIFGTDRSLAGTLSSGLRSLRRLGGRGGRSRSSKAKSIDMAYSIGTVLLIDLIFLFIFPPVGQIFSMSPIQFGDWAEDRDPQLGCRSRRRP